MSKCPICGEKLGLLTKAKTSDGEICALCATICSSHATLPTATIKAFWDTNRKRLEEFTPTQVLKSFGSDVITIDDTHRLFIFGDLKKMKNEPVVFGFDEVESYEFETVGGKTVTKKKGGITRAVVGGVVAGPIGALVGSGTAKAETQTVGGIRMTKVNFNTYTGKLQRMSGKYPMGFTDFLDRCISEASAEPTATGQVSSAADEILKFKDLLDKGVITPEEFAAKKSQLLGL